MARSNRNRGTRMIWAAEDLHWPFFIPLSDERARSLVGKARLVLVRESRIRRLLGKAYQPAAV